MQIIPPKKILGVFGGMGPAASAEFMRLLTLKSPARKDQEHPLVYLLSDSQVPDRGAAIRGEIEDLAPRMKTDLEKLISWGADILATPCNTAHVFIDRFYEALSVPYLHIVKETIASCQLKSPQGAWLLATTATCDTGLYERHATAMGYSFRKVDAAVQREVQCCVEEVKAARMEDAGKRMHGIVKNLWKEKDLLVATACTELPLAFDASGLPADRNVSSLAALSEACLEALYPGLYQRG
jgi:aspartate racemase